MAEALISTPVTTPSEVTGPTVNPSATLPTQSNVCTKPKYTKSEINIMKVSLLKSELAALNLPVDGAGGVLRTRLKAAVCPPPAGKGAASQPNPGQPSVPGSANYGSASQPNPSPASSSAITAELRSASQPNPSPVPSVQAEGREQWHHFNQTRGSPVYARIPAASRNKASQVLSTLLNGAYTVNGKPEWDKLYGFAKEGLGSSKRGGKKHTSQATLINKRLDAFVAGTVVVEPPPKKTTKAKSSGQSKADYASRVAAKLGMGDVRGAVTIVTSKEAILPPSQETKVKLQVKHPPRKRSELTRAPTPDFSGNLGHFWLSKDDIKWGLRSFKKGAAGGPDGLRPQHLLDMTGQALGETGNRLLETLVDFLNLCVLPGKVNEKTQATFYSGNLTALLKPDGSVRPIVAGLVFRRLAAKCVMKKLRSFCVKEFRPLQMGVGTPKGCEAAVHATRAYVESDSVQDQVLLKIDFKNAFNSVHRDVVLKLVRGKNT